MNRAIPAGAAAALAAVLALALLAEPPEEEGVAFHATLADPGLYEDGVFTGAFSAGAGTYHFRFVPNGSSPETLSISLEGSSVEFAEDFALVGTKADTADYYTWRYDGTDTVTVPEAQEITVTIDPNGNVLGSVTVDILGE